VEPESSLVVMHLVQTSDNIKQQMTYTSVVYHYDTIPSDLMDVITKDLETNFDPFLETSKLYGGGEDLDKRKSRNAWVPTTHWIGGLVWNYIEKANKEIFHYDLDFIDGESMQYTHYGIGEYYDWHQDEGLGTMYKPATAGQRGETIVQDFLNEKAEKVRKLTCILQLADEKDYTGGKVQLRDIDNTSIFAPKQRGSLILFDSRLQHRAMRVDSGLRKSLISWCVGNRWK